MPEINDEEEGVWIHVSHDRPAIKVVHEPTAKRLLSEGGRIVSDPRLKQTEAARPVQEEKPAQETSSNTPVARRDQPTKHVGKGR